ncbi:MAG: hypothetical protein EAZ92_04820 [Candidatus Kapaibacterium sp.]|nr:MAG: hypothetical protein EAZ92_04820 [Candidatus Kapabacteria bacterium]
MQSSQTQTQDYMRHSRLLLASVIPCLFLCAACAMIVVKEPTNTRTITERDQESPQGVVLLFKAEIDSNNVQAAIKVMASDDERPLLAIEKLDMQEEIARLGRIITKRDITAQRVDTLSPVRQRLRTEFGYLKELTFMTVRIDSLWFISKISER